MITHPFHPFRGRALRIYDRVGGSRRATLRYFVDGPAGTILATIPVSWTSVRRVDDYERVSSGRSLFRSDDLMELREVVDSLLGLAAGRDQK